jgi:hypothetical protein
MDQTLLNSQISLYSSLTLSYTEVFEWFFKTSGIIFEISAENFDESNVFVCSNK